MGYGQTDAKPAKRGEPVHTETLTGLLDAAWYLLSAAAEAGSKSGGPRNDVPGLVTFATVDRSGAPAQRAVVLRGADRVANILSIHTNAATIKMAELAASPAAAIHFWDAPSAIQIRATGTAQRRDRTAELRLWETLPERSRANYGVEPAPGTAIPAPDAYVREANRDRFAILDLRIEHLDLVHLAEDYHRRAAFARTDGWRGEWLAP